MAGRRRQVVWSPSAKDALDDAISYISEDSREAAARVLVDILEAADGLHDLGERGRVVPEIDEPTIREVSVHRYRLIYQVYGDEIRIVTLLHGARDFERWKRRNS